ncbi:hypothetical protein L195_g035512, partial [Trifolium pratense]
RSDEDEDMDINVAYPGV